VDKEVLLVTRIVDLSWANRPIQTVRGGHRGAP